MKSHEAMDIAIGRHTEHVSKAVGLGTSTVHKWQEPYKAVKDIQVNRSGTYNPLDRIETVIEAALKCSQSEKDAYAPIRFLAQRFNQILVPLPEKSKNLTEVQRELMRTIKEFSDLTQTASEGLEDGEVTRMEAKDIIKEGWELIQQVSAFMKLIEDHT